MGEGSSQKPNQGGEQPESVNPAASPVPDQDQEVEENDAWEEEATPLGPMNFPLFVLSLNTSALMHLGHGPQQQGKVNLPMARQVIDILAMLEEKTRGNLSGDEERLLHQVLFELRMRYAREAKANPSSAPGE